MRLESLVQQVAVLEKLINDTAYAMRHSSPQSVDALRKQKEELEAVYNELMESCVVSNFDLEYMLSAHGECLRECFRPSYTNKPVILPKPKWDSPPSPPPEEEEPPKPTVPGVNLIMYIDSTGSMRDDLGSRGIIRKTLEEFANYLKTESTRGGIPCTVSLIWFGDATDGDGRTTYYSINMNKEDVSNFPTKLAYPKWYSGGITEPESGILAMKETLPQVVKSGVANTLIYITDAPSKSNEFGATPTSVKILFNSLDIKPYAIIPYKNPDIKSIFLDTRNFADTPYNILPWADKTLRP